MSQPETPPIADGSIIERVVLVDRLERSEFARFESYSLPGHLVQLVVSGRVHQEMEGRRYDLGPGLAIWYHDDELTKSEVLEPPWIYYTVNFVAPTLSPRPFDQRVKRVGDEAVRGFERLLTAWRETSVPTILRHMRVHARLLELLVEVLPAAGTTFRMDPAARLWWNLEARIRADLSQPIDLRTIRRLTRRSLRTIVRSCHCAVGMPPMQRVKQMRLGMARGLVVYTIYNHSFQDGPKNVDIPQWGDVDMLPDAPADSPWSVCQEGPDASNFFNGIGVDGDQFALVDAGGYYAYQDTAATFVSGASYDLVVAVGRRWDHDELMWPDTAWQISLHYAADGTEVASLAGVIGLFSGGFMSDQALHYVAQPDDDGKTIQVRVGGTAETGSTAGYDNVRLRIGSAPSLPGDANDDGVVDDKDASILGAHWLTSGASWADGDFNDDNVVDDKDAAILAAYWGQGNQENSVPEPATGILVVLGLAALVIRRCLR